MKPVKIIIIVLFYLLYLDELHDRESTVLYTVLSTVLLVVWEDRGFRMPHLIKPLEDLTCKFCSQD